MITSLSSEIYPDERHTVAVSVSDILALERQINAPVQSRPTSREAHCPAKTIVKKIATLSGQHIDALAARLEVLGKPTTHGVSSDQAQLVGAGGGALNRVRGTKISTSLRDDYTALSLAAISYTMLQATASGLGDSATASLAKRHLDDIAPLIVDISSAMPEIVLTELSGDGETVSIGLGQFAERGIRR